MPRWMLAIALLLPLVAAGARAAEPVVLPGSTWSGSALLKAKLSARGAGSDSLQGAASFRLSFGPLAAPALGDAEFLLEIDDGQVALQIPGSYTVDAKRRVLLAPDVSVLDTQLTNLIIDICLEEFGGSICDLLALLDLAIDRADVRVKARSKKGVETLQTKGGIAFAFLSPEDGSPLLRVKLGFRTGKDVTRD